jgi:hypothetical protein
MSALIRAYRPYQSCFEIEDKRYGLPLLTAMATKSSAEVQAMLELRAEQLSEFSFTHFSSLLPSSPDISNASSRNFTYSRKRKIFPQLVEYENEMISLFFLSIEKCDIDSKVKQ